MIDQVHAFSQTTAILRNQLSYKEITKKLCECIKHNICSNQNFIISLHQPKLKLFQFKLVLEKTNDKTKPVENQMIKQRLTWWLSFGAVPPALLLAWLAPWSPWAPPRLEPAPALSWRDIFYLKNIQYK